MHVVLSTCLEDPELYESDALFASALERRGHTVSAIPWNREAAPAGSADDDPYAGVDAVVLRANWDYHEEPGAFLAWLDGLDERGVRVLNDTALVRWNFDKRYLLELQEMLSTDVEAAGEAEAEGGTAATATLRIPEVHVVNQHDPDSIVALMARLGWEEAVLKSLSGQSGYHCERIRRDAPEAWEAAARAIPTKVALLQAFQPSISALSETVFVFFLGEFSHATRRVVADGERENDCFDFPHVCPEPVLANHLLHPQNHRFLQTRKSHQKRAVFAGEWRANSRFGAVKEAVVSPSPLLVEQARRVLQAAPAETPPLYARVDGIVDGQCETKRSPFFSIDFLVKTAVATKTGSGRT